MSVISYLDFDLLISRSEAGYTARVLRSPANTDCAISEFQPPFSDIEIEEFLRKIGKPRRTMRRLESPQTEEAKRFGGRLFESVFSKDVLGCLRKSLALASRQDTGLRVRLHLRDAPVLADLPWEYLYDTISTVSSPFRLKRPWCVISSYPKPCGRCKSRCRCACW